MKLPDVNIWLALTLSQHSHHHVARACSLLTTAEVLAAYGEPVNQTWLEDLLRRTEIPGMSNPAAASSCCAQLAPLLADRVLVCEEAIAAEVFDVWPLDKQATPVGW